MHSAPSSPPEERPSRALLQRALAAHAATSTLARFRGPPRQGLQNVRTSVIRRSSLHILHQTRRPGPFSASDGLQGHGGGRFAPLSLQHASSHLAAAGQARGRWSARLPPSPQAQACRSYHVACVGALESQPVGGGETCQHAAADHVEQTCCRRRTAHRRSKPLFFKAGVMMGVRAARCPGTGHQSPSLCSTQHRTVLRSKPTGDGRASGRVPLPCRQSVTPAPEASARRAGPSGEYIRLRSEPPSGAVWGAWGKEGAQRRAHLRAGQSVAVTAAAESMHLPLWKVWAPYVSALT